MVGWVIGKNRKREPVCRLGEGIDWGCFVKVYNGLVKWREYFDLLALLYCVFRRKCRVDVCCGFYRRDGLQGIEEKQLRSKIKLYF